MPVEIRELTIKVQVDEQAGNRGSTGNATDKVSGDKSEVIKEAVEETMRILESKKER